MARNIDPKQAAVLVQECESLLVERDSALKICDELEEAVRKELSKLTGSISFCRTVERDLAEAPKEMDAFLLSSLTSAIDRSLTARGAMKYLENTKLGEAGEARIQIENLKPAQGSLRWLFSSQAKKTAAEAAYFWLSGFRDEGNSAAVRTAKSELKSASKGGKAKSTAPTGSVAAIYLKELERCCAQMPKIQVPAVDAVINAYDKVLQTQSDIEEAETSLRSKVENAATRLTAIEAFRYLKELPIETLNQEKRGIRVKLLRDAGLESVGDVVAATRWQIATINGISEEGAAEVKRMAEQFSQKASSMAKIKISADDKNQYATNLVVSIAQHLRAAEAKGFFIRERAGEKVYIAAKERLSGFDFAVWPFATTQEKKEAADAYKLLTDITSRVGFEPNRLAEMSRSIEQLDPNRAWEEFSKSPVQFYNDLEEIAPGVLGNDDGLYGLPEELAREIQDQCFFPDGLLCTLRRYQEWGVKYILHQEKVLLGDEMGLGKTVQAIAAMVSLKNTGASHFMVICPASVLTNWSREVEKHSKLRAVKVHGASREAAYRDWIEAGGVAVTTYETTGALLKLAKHDIDLLVVDEAHYAKNPDAKRTQNVKSLCQRSERILFMTGTALENKVDEMISLISILRPKIADELEGYSFMAAAPQFREKVAPVYYRRKREDVLTELPELIETHEWCSMGAEEEAVYEQAVLGHEYAEARRVSWSIDHLEASSKAQRLLEIVQDAQDEGRKVIVFSFFLDTIRKVGSLLGSQCYGPINGSVPVARRQQILDEFEKAAPGSVLAAQIQAGGTGLNIQSASVVVICEPQFKPSIENQAISRAYRMGQTRNVLVFRLLCADSIDERLTNLLAEKQQIFNAFADESVAASESFELDEKSFGSLINEEIERIKAKKGITNDSLPAIKSPMAANQPKTKPEIASRSNRTKTTKEPSQMGVFDVTEQDESKKAEPAWRFCPFCGAKLIEGGAFCPSCGHAR